MAALVKAGLASLTWIIDSDQFAIDTVHLALIWNIQNLSHVRRANYWLGIGIILENKQGYMRIRKLNDYDNLNGPLNCYLLQMYVTLGTWFLNSILAESWQGRINKCKNLSFFYGLLVHASFSLEASSMCTKGRHSNS